MALKLSGKSSGGSSSVKHLPKEGARPARLISVYDLGVHKCSYKGEAKPDAQLVVLEYDLVDDLADFGGDDLQPIRINTGWYFPLKVSYDKKGGLNDKSNLYKHTSALDPTNSWDGDLSALVNNPCIITVKLNTKGDNTYANIGGISPIPDMEGFSIKETPNTPYIFDYDTHTKEEWDALPEFMQNKIAEAIDFDENRFD